MSITSQSSAAEIDEFLSGYEEDEPAYYFVPEHSYDWSDTVYPDQWFAVDGWYDVGEWSKPTLVSSEPDGPTVFTAEVVENFGGEGQGDNYYLVLRITFPDGVSRLYRKPGYYASYDGGTYDGDLYEVKPVVREVTFYE